MTRPDRPIGRVGAGVLLLAAACGWLTGCHRESVGGAIASGSFALDRPRNLLLLSIDTLRADHLSCYGYARQTSPVIDQLAREGRLFTNVFATSVHTAPSHMSLFTSQYPFEHGIRSQFRGTFTGSASTLAEVLQRAGYETAAFVGHSGPKFRFGPDAGHARGFQLWDHPNSFYALNAKIRPWLEAHREQPFFLFVHAYDVHNPHLVLDGFDARRFDPEYHGPVPGTWSEFLRATNFPLDWPAVMQLRVSATHEERVALMKQIWQYYDPLLDEAAMDHVRAVYDAQIFYTDRGIGRLLGWLQELGLEATTLVVLTGDHGQEFGEHGAMVAHQQLYDELLHVPLILRGPGIRPDPSLPQVVSSIDVLPTVLDLLGVPIPQTVRGINLVPLFREPGRGEIHEAVFAQIRDDLAVRTPAWKLIVRSDGRRELYRLQQDPQERANVIAQHPTVAAALSRQLDEQLRAVGTHHVAGQEALKERLRTEGYW